MKGERRRNGEERDAEEKKKGKRSSEGSSGSSNAEIVKTEELCCDKHTKLFTILFWSFAFRSFSEEGSS